MQTESLLKSIKDENWRGLTELIVFSESDDDILVLKVMSMHGEQILAHLSPDLKNSLSIRLKEIKERNFAESLFRDLCYISAERGEFEEFEKCDQTEFVETMCEVKQVLDDELSNEVSLSLKANLDRY